MTTTPTPALVRVVSFDRHETVVVADLEELLP
jgi:hypothetical protein